MKKVLRIVCESKTFFGIFLKQKGVSKYIVAVVVFAVVVVVVVVFAVVDDVVEKTDVCICFGSGDFLGFFLVTFCDVD